ncbi:TRAP transporter large permease [Pseudophaeobacter sp.]|uniref:TRAP transporter large permease n=1 Tax=Pseudophaeobacter sp. TaxID=1971739 RepID=UPI00329795AF
MVESFPIEAWGGIGFLSLLALVFLRVPIAIAMAAVGLVGGTLLTGIKPTGLTFASSAFESVFPYSLSVIPLFILMGVFVTHADLSQRLYDGMHALVGHWRGGLAQATIGACAMFGAICGSSLATAATMTRVAMPEMRKRGYQDGLATGAIAAGGTLGILIPPSIILLIYGILTGTSVGKLFIAGLIPGLIGTVFYLGAVRYSVWRNPTSAPNEAKPPISARLRQLIGVWQVVLLFGLVLGGIYTGWFSTIEAAAVGAFGGLLAATLRHRSLSFLPAALEEAAKTTAMIFLIIVGTAAFNAFIERTHLPETIVNYVALTGLSPMGILVLLMLIYLALGCVMDGLSVIFVTIPIVFPLVQSLGIDPVWFGILLVCATEIGLITPPVGMNLFIIKGLTHDISIRTIWKGVAPFIVADVLRLAVLLTFPMLTLYLTLQVR